MRGVEVYPARVSTAQSLGGRFGSRRVAGQPLRDVPRIDLFRPQQSGEGLPLHLPLFVIQIARQTRVEAVGLRLAVREYLLHALKGRVLMLSRKSQQDRFSAVRQDLELVLERHLRPNVPRIDRGVTAL